MPETIDLFLVFIRPLNRLSIPYMVTGSAASMAYGEPRMTHDIDLVVELRGCGDVASQFTFPISPLP